MWELVLRYNYTLNLNGTYEAIKYMYTYWPDPHNVTHIRDQYIQVSFKKTLFSVVICSFITAAIRFLICCSK